MFDLSSTFLSQQDKVSASGKAANVSPLFIEPKVIRVKGWTKRWRLLFLNKKIFKIIKNIFYTSTD